MRQVCTRCYTLVPEGTQWCRTQGCGPGTLSVLFDPGETINEFTVLAMLQVFRTTALYRVQRGRDKFLMKVAHRRSEELLKEEARLLTRLDHPNLPKLVAASSLQKDHAYERTSVGGEMKYFLVIENAEGLFLPDHLDQQGRFTDQHAVWLTLKIAEAVVYLHRTHGILLRNLHSSGIMLCPEKNSPVPRPLLLDLSLAGPAGVPRDGSLLEFGVQNTLAPEIVRGAAVTEQTDVYGLGLILYEMLTGQPPYPGKLLSDEEIRRSVLNSPPQSIRSLRPELNDAVVGAVVQAVRPQPEARQPTVGTLGRMLHKAFGAAPSAGGRSGLNTRKLLAVVIAIILIVLIGLLVFLLLPR